MVVMKRIDVVFCFFLHDKFVSTIAQQLSAYIALNIYQPLPTFALFPNCCKIPYRSLKQKRKYKVNSKIITQRRRKYVS